MEHVEDWLTRIDKSEPIYRILGFANIKESLNDLASMLGVERLLKHINSLDLNNDFILNEWGYILKSRSSVKQSRFFRDIYFDFIGSYEALVLDMITFENIDVYIKKEFKPIKDGMPQYKMSLLFTVNDPEFMDVEFSEGKIKKIFK